MAKKTARKTKTKRSQKQPAKAEAPKQELIQIKLQRVVPDNVKAQFSNHVVVVSEQSVFNVYFYHYDPPSIMGEDGSLHIDLDKATLKATCVSHIVIPADLMPQVIGALSGNFRSHQLRSIEATKVVDANPEATQATQQPKLTAEKKK